VTELEQLRKDLEALERWLVPGALDTRKLTIGQLVSLGESVDSVTAKMIGFRVGLARIVTRRQRSN
jgi:hypothetical protein